MDKKHLTPFVEKGRNCFLVFLSVCILQTLIYLTLFTRSRNPEEEHSPSMKWSATFDPQSTKNNSNYEQNPIYRRFGIKPALKKETFTLVLIVSSAPQRVGRRNAIRETWWPGCKSTGKITVKCIFMTDKINSSALLLERQKFQDMEFQRLSGGVEFGKRFLYHMVWAALNYNFDYFMRMDDDYFLCIDRFLSEIPIPAPKLYHWGWVHCIPKLVRPEESIIMFSRDLLELYLNQDAYDMQCHPWADQMIGAWTQQLKLKKTFRHDSRLHHDPPSAFIEKLGTEANICSKYIGLHGSYEKEQRIFWSNRGNQSINSGLSLSNFSSFCVHEQIMIWTEFNASWRSEPKPCINEPVWKTENHKHGLPFYGGRQKGQT